MHLLERIELQSVGIDQPNLLPFSVALLKRIEILVHICQLIAEQQWNKSFGHAVDVPLDQLEIAFFGLANRVRYPGELQESADQCADREVMATAALAVSWPDWLFTQ
jgi:hypothetical protein